MRNVAGNFSPVCVFPKMKCTDVFANTSTVKDLRLHSVNCLNSYNENNFFTIRNFEQNVEINHVTRYISFFCVSLSIIPNFQVSYLVTT